MKNYADYLYEHAAPSIMAWIIEGARKVIAGNHKLKKPAVVENAIAQYRGMNDWMGIFLEECCDVGDGLEQKAGGVLSGVPELLPENREFTVTIQIFCGTGKTWFCKEEKHGRVHL